MSLSIATKGIIAFASASALGGASYGAYSYLNSSTSVKEALMKNQKTPLNLTATTGQEDYEAWKELAKQYHHKKFRGKKEIKDFSISSADNVTALQEKCKVLLDSNSKNKNYDRDLADAEDWCTKENAPQKVEKLLEKKGKVLLATDGSSADDWATQWKAFKTAYEGKELVADWNFADWVGKQKQQTIQQELKTRCSANGKESLIPNRDEALLSEIISFCTKDKVG